MASKKADANIRMLEERMRGNPRSRAFSRLADSYRASGNLQKAIDICVGGLKEHPNYVTGRLVLGRCYAEQKNFEAAVFELTAVCSADRRNHAAMKLLADVFVKQGRGEVGGRVYSILRDMEPDNDAIRQLAAKHRSKMRGTLLDILGIRDDVESLTRNLMNSGADPFNMQNSETIQGAQTDFYGSDTPTMADYAATPQHHPAGSPSGGDVADQLDMMFGDTPQPAPPTPAPYQQSAQPEQFAPAQQPPASAAAFGAAPAEEVTGSDVANQLDMMFGDVTPPSLDTAGIDTGVISFVSDQGTDQLTGADIENTIDAMFGTTSAPPVPPPAPSFDAAVTEEVTGSDVSDALDAMFGNQTPPSLDVAGTDTGIAVPPEMPDAEGITGNDVVNSIDAMFGNTATPRYDAPHIDQPAAPSVERPSGEDVASKLDAIFGTQAKPPDVTPISADMTNLGSIPELDAVTGSDIADSIDAMFGITPPQSQSDAAPAAESAAKFTEELVVDSDTSVVSGVVDGGDTPTNLFDFGAEETLQFDSRDLAAAMTAEKDMTALFDFGAEETLLTSASDVLLTDTGGFANQFDFAASETPADDAQQTVSMPAVGDTVSLSRNVETSDADTISFGHDAVESASLEDSNVVSGEDVEARLSEFFGEDTVTDESLTADELAGIDDILTSIDAASAAEAAAADDGVLTDSVDFAGANETLSMDDLEDIVSGGDIADVVDTDEGTDAAVAMNIGDDTDTATNIDTGIVNMEDDTDTAANVNTSNINADSDKLPTDGLDDLEEHLREILGEDVEIGSFDPSPAEDVSPPEAKAFNGSDVIEKAAVSTNDTIEETLVNTNAKDNNLDESLIKQSSDIIESSLETLSAEINAAGIDNDTDTFPSVAEPAVSEDDVQDRIRDLFKQEKSEAVNVIDVGVDSTIDERDTPFDLPDHVLTPTLADIYYQQGQPKLALHIYERLSIRDPEDQRLQLQVQAIRDALLQMGDDAGLDTTPIATADKPKRSPSAAKKKTSVKEDKRPLAGVRISKKGKTPAKKRTNK